MNEKQSPTKQPENAATEQPERVPEFVVPTLSRVANLISTECMAFRNKYTTRIDMMILCPSKRTIINRYDRLMKSAFFAKVDG